MGKIREIEWYHKEKKKNQNKKTEEKQNLHGKPLTHFLF
jgi:hypothetical protein